jgi:hypothetical protein
MKGRCWCCWETSDFPSDPLIRVCTGCKDIDLQYIHQSCINNYLTTVSSIEKISLACARCKTPYNVQEIPIHFLKTLFNERLLCGSVSVMTLSMLVVNICIILILNESYDTQQHIFENGPELLKIKKSWFAMVMFFVCNAIFIATWKIVHDSCKGFTMKRVKGIEEGKMKSLPLKLKEKEE